MIYSLSALSISTLFLGASSAAAAASLWHLTRQHTARQRLVRGSHRAKTRIGIRNSGKGRRGIGNSRIEMKTMLRYFLFTDMITRRRWMHANVCVCVCINIRADG